MSFFRNQLHPTWRTALSESLPLLDQIEERLAGEAFLPQPQLVLRSLGSDIAKIKVLIVGQDPYPNSEFAMGLAFSLPREQSKTPPTLRNIFKELVADVDSPYPASGDLTPWCDEGVMLLNRVLTCREKESGSHRDIGWQAITDEIARILGARGVVGILWGKSASELSRFFAQDRLITSVHPSPLSAYRGFFGSRPFSRSNQMLKEGGVESIDWSL